MAIAEYRDLLRHMEWADSLVWTAVLAVQSMGRDPQLRERLHHLHSTQWAFLQIWRGETLHIPELAGFPNLRSIGTWARGYYLELPGFVEGLREPFLADEIRFPWAEELERRLGSVGPVTLAESILQLVLHTAHHRGQVAMLSRERGGEPPLIDYLAWVCRRRPAPTWDGFGEPSR